MIKTEVQGCQGRLLQGSVVFKLSLEAEREKTQPLLLPLAEAASHLSP